MRRGYKIREQSFLRGNANCVSEKIAFVGKAAHLHACHLALSSERYLADSEIVLTPGAIQNSTCLQKIAG